MDRKKFIKKVIVSFIPMIIFISIFYILFPEDRPFLLLITLMSVFTTSIVVNLILKKVNGNLPKEQRDLAKGQVEKVEEKIAILNNTVQPIRVEIIDFLLLKNTFYPVLQDVNNNQWFVLINRGYNCEYVTKFSRTESGNFETLVQLHNYDVYGPNKTKIDIGSVGNLYCTKEFDPIIYNKDNKNYSISFHGLGYMYKGSWNHNKDIKIGSSDFINIVDADFMNSVGNIIFVEGYLTFDK